MNRKRVNLKAGRVCCPASAILEFHLEKLRRVTLEPSSSLNLYFEGFCPDEGAIIQWFEAFLSGNHLPFPLSLELETGPFLSRALDKVSQIPFGEVKTYGEIAALLDNPKGARAVGNACNRNPFPLIIPCHRIVRNGGKMGGFAYGISMKEHLLEFEQRTILENQAARL